jgi:pre-rRNA-processing protein TSR1
MDVEPTVLAEPSSSADSLVSSNDPDDLANEQTWPTEEEMQDTADASQELPKSKKNGKRIPKGMSEYQASWILDEDEDEDEDDRAEDHEVEMQEDEDEEMVEMHVDDDHEMEMDGRRSVAFHDLDNEEEAKQFAFFCFLLHHALD